MKTGYTNLRCGLIGRKLSHSFSKIIHEKLADYSFELVELEPNELEPFVKSGKLDAFCVTIPYKKDIMPLLDRISPEALAIGAVNVVVRESDGKLCGYNTDHFGFDYTLRSSNVDPAGKKVLVFGRGGAASTVITLLNEKACKEVVTLGSRDNTPQNRAKHADAELIVNASPVGMYPNNYASPCAIDEFPDCSAVFDLIYNPSKTELIQAAEKKGILARNGLTMLVAQAARAFELFTSDTCEREDIDTIISDISTDTANIILIGMPGSGKSSVGKALAQKLGRPFFDADAEFEKMHALSPADAILSLGEEKFRELESITLAELGKICGAVIATGGGAVTKERNYPLLSQNGVIIFIERELSKLARDGRPLSQASDMQTLYKNRIDAYRRFADATVNSKEDPELTAEDAASEFVKFFKKEQL